MNAATPHEATFAALGRVRLARESLARIVDHLGRVQLAAAEPLIPKSRGLLAGVTDLEADLERLAADVAPWNYKPGQGQA